MVGWIRRYERRWLKDDLIAGFAVAALIVPKNLGYAGIAGIPLQNGLYAAAAGELPKLTGTKATGSNPLQELWSWFGTLGDAQGLTLVVGLVALAVVFGLRVIAQIPAEGGTRAGA